MTIIFLLILLLFYQTILEIYKESSSFLDYFLLLIFILFFSSITIAPDLLNYKLGYSYEHTYTTNAGFWMLCRFFSQNGFSFYNFYLIGHVICIILVFLSIRLISTELIKCILPYLFFPFLCNVVQLKNFFMMSLVLFAFSACCRCKNRNIEILLWVALSILAGSMHVAGFAYLPFIFLTNKKNILKKILLFMVPLTLFFALSNGSNLTYFLKPLMQATIDDSFRAEKYSEKASQLGSILYMSQSLLMIYIASITKYAHTICFKTYSVESTFLDKDAKFIDYAYTFILYGCFFWPLFVASGSFGRLIQNQMIIIYLLIISFFSIYNRLEISINRIVAKDMLMKIVLCFSSLILLQTNSLWITHWEDIFINIFSNLKFLYAFL